MHHSETHRDPWWQALAARLGTPEGLRTARRLQREGFFDQEEPAPFFAASPSGGPQPISIWQPHEIDGTLVFERPDPLAIGDHYAARKRIIAQKDSSMRRICFFGESVAAGYLYAPHLTPAMVLEHHLRAASGGGGYEVIDLARTNETLASLVTTVERAMQLEPDALVLFVGNNWTLLETPYVSPYVPSVRARQQYGQALREAGVLGPIERAARHVFDAAAAALDRIGEIARAASIPVVLIVPEVNLADWETRQPPVWLPGDAIARWYRLYDAALDALTQEDWAGAAASAQALIDLDGATCPSSFRLLAKAYTGAGDLAQARAACRAEIDANQYATLCFLSAPQATQMAQALQRRAAYGHGFSAVDLPQVFAEYIGSPLPGRRLFLDYCHLTVEGMHLAMAAVTADVLRLFGEDGGSWKTLSRLLPEPHIAPEAEATARFGAALHSAHRLSMVGDRASLLAYWCRAALNASPGIERAMLDFVAVRTTRCPTVLTAAQQRNYASPYRLTLQHGWHYDYLDADVIEAVYAVVGSSARAEIRRMLLACRLPPEGVDLAYPPFYLREPLEQFYPAVMAFEDLGQRATYRAPWPVSRFCLIEDASRDVELSLTARLPTIEGFAPPSEASVRVTVNGTEVGIVAVGARWGKASLRLDRRMLREGINTLSLRWPFPSTPGEAALEAAVDHLEQGREADLHPVFGEVFSLVATPC